MQRITAPSARDKGLYAKPLWIQDLEAAKNDDAALSLQIAVDHLISRVGSASAARLLVQAAAAIL